jgi:hypothetical protein
MIFHFDHLRARRRCLCDQAHTENKHKIAHASLRKRLAFCRAGSLSVFQDCGLRLCDEGGGGGGLVPPGGGEDTDGLVVTRQTVDTGLDENQAELGVLVLAVALEVLADGDGLADVSKIRPCGFARPIVYGCTHLLDEHVKVLGDLGGEACISLCQSETKQRRNCDMYVMYVVFQLLPAVICRSGFSFTQVVAYRWT